MSAEKHSGSCLCGAITFEIEGGFDAFFLCHCGRCQKDTGSAHAANLFSSTARLIWLTGENRVRGFQLPETRHQRSFCSACGSALPSVQQDGGLIVVPAGSLDEAVSSKPTAHIFWDRRANWDCELEQVQKFDDLPK